ncbi:hypothetical protein [Methylobrevis albus]|uniref:Uncharacterized protein n=1 Tax=Methylobrevis albus TaxID=2793297 RepID=A0A931I0N5_9HYPH|nr:hypothetical protein [Methylobrevis albus]MBH0237170.1 hypothetical protein [Methylobrevis albus]
MGLVIEFGVSKPRINTRPRRDRSADVMIFPGVRIERHAERDPEAAARRAEIWRQPRWKDYGDE